MLDALLDNNLHYCLVSKALFACEMHTVGLKDDGPMER